MQNTVETLVVDTRPRLVNVSDEEGHGDMTTRFDFHLTPYLAFLHGVHPEVRLSVTTYECEAEYDEDGAVIYGGELGLTCRSVRRGTVSITGESSTQDAWPDRAAEALANPADTMLRLLSKRDRFAR